MDRLGSRLLCRRDERLSIQVALACLSRADADGFISSKEMRGRHIGFRVDSNGGNAEFTTGARHTNGDLAAIGDQNFLKHGAVFPPARYRAV